MRVQSSALVWAGLLWGALGGCAAGEGGGFDGFGGAASAEGGGGTGKADTEGGDDDDFTTSLDGGATQADDGSGGMDDDTGDSDGSGSTDGGPGCDPPCPSGEECLGGVCFPVDDTGGSGGSSGGPGCNEADGSYGLCLQDDGSIDNSNCGGTSPTCLTGGDPAIVGVCAFGCDDACDCPAAPATGTSPVDCDDLTGGGDNFCYLDCSTGQTCPDSTQCFADLVCVWPSAAADGEPYGDCFNNGFSICGLDGVCLNDGDPATIGVCTEACNTVGDCWVSPGGTAPVVCSDVTNDGANECTLDCSTGGTCPTGMTCFQSSICVFS